MLHCLSTCIFPTPVVPQSWDTVVHKTSKQFLRLARHLVKTGLVSMSPPVSAKVQSVLLHQTQLTEDPADPQHKAEQPPSRLGIGTSDDLTENERLELGQTLLLNLGLSDINGAFHTFRSLAMGFTRSLKVLCCYSIATAVGVMQFKLNADGQLS